MLTKKFSKVPVNYFNEKKTRDQAFFRRKKVRRNKPIDLSQLKKNTSAPWNTILIVFWVVKYSISRDF